MRRLLVLTLVAMALAGCTRAPQESTGTPTSTAAPDIVVVRNDAWRMAADGNETFKLIVLDITAHGDLQVRWHDILLNTSAQPLSPSSAFEHPPNNWTVAWTSDHVLKDNQTVRLELHYRSATMYAVDHGTFDWTTGDGKGTLVTFTLPPESPAPG